MASFSTSFTQADGPVSSTDWTTVGGLTAMQVASNHLTAPATGVNYGAWLNTSIDASTYARGGFTAQSVDGIIQLWMRMNNTTFNGYVATFNGGSGTVNIARVDGGTQTIIVGPTAGFGDGTYLLEFEMTGSTFKAFIGGTQIVSVTDSTYATGTETILLYSAASGTTTIDDFTITNVPAGAGITGTIAAAGPVATSTIAGTVTPPVTGVVAATTDVATSSIAGTNTAPPGFSGVIAAVADVATSSIAGTFVPQPITGVVAATTDNATSLLAGTNTPPPGPVSGTLTASTDTPTASIVGTFTVPVTGVIAAATAAPTAAFVGTSSTPSTAPAKVTGLTATQPRRNNVALSWTAPSTGGSPITGYKIERTRDDGGEAPTYIERFDYADGLAASVVPGFVNVGSGPLSVFNGRLTTTTAVEGQSHEGYLPHPVNVTGNSWELIFDFDCTGSLSYQDAGILIGLVDGTTGDGYGMGIFDDQVGGNTTTQWHVYQYDAGHADHITNSGGHPWTGKVRLRHYMNASVPMLAADYWHTDTLQWVQEPDSEIPPGYGGLIAGGLIVFFLVSDVDPTKVWVDNIIINPYISPSNQPGYVPGVPDDDEWEVVVANTGTAATTYLDTTVIASEAPVTYWYRVTAINANGAGPASDPKDITVVPMAPPSFVGDLEIKKVLIGTVPASAIYVGYARVW